MTKIYRDNFFHIEQHELREDGDIFQTILDAREGLIDSKRFYLSYISQRNLDKYELTNPESLDEFRTACVRMDGLLHDMGGCNLSSNNVSNDIRTSGIRISDPHGNIYGCFNIGEGKVIYSPIFPHFYEERDLIKYANDSYFTSMTFEEIMLNQVDLAREFYVHTGNPKTIVELRKHGRYILEPVNKDEMVTFIKKQEEGEKVLRKSLGIK